MLRAHAADGRKFIEESRERYDVVFLDAYGDDCIPQHLTTREFLRATRAILSPKGVVVGNVWGRTSNRLYDSMVRTYQDVFDELYVFPVPLRDNVILLGVPRKGEISREGLAKSAGKLAKAKDIPFDLGELVGSCFQDSRKLSIEGKVLEDVKEKSKEEPRAVSPGALESSKEKEATPVGSPGT
jgi:spermidine synthase